MRSTHTLPSLNPLAALAPFAVVALGASAGAQVTFSTDYMSPLRPLVSHGDVLTTAAGGMPVFGPLPPPIPFLPGGLGGLGIPAYPGCIGSPAPIPCPTEVDALSFGTDFPLRPTTHLAHTIEFSVDEFAIGIAGSPLAPNVGSESAVFDTAADVFGDMGLPPAPMPILLGGNTGLVDGDGGPSISGAVYPGLGLVEPNPPALGPVVDGDNLDAWDRNDGPPAAPFPVYFSLDAGFFDPLRGMPNTGSGPANGFPGSAVLVTPVPGGAPVMYAPPPALGLDLLAVGVDDLDALALFENGIPGFQASPAPYMWAPAAPFDMLLFSVRRGSAVIGAPDSLTGLPICEGDVLIPPVAGGLSPFPGILVPAERLGLATMRSLGVVFSDDLDALDTVWRAQTSTGYCFGTLAACPCGNLGAPGNGCANSNVAAGGNLSAVGTASVLADTVVMTGTNMPNGPCLYFQGTGQVSVPFGDGLRCVAGAVIRLGIKFNAGNTSSIPVGADPPLSVSGLIPIAGGTRFYQCWYRDAMAFCTPSTFNLTNGIAITWTP